MLRGCACDIWNTGCNCDSSLLEKELDQADTECGKIRLQIQDLEERIEHKKAEIWDKYVFGHDTELAKVQLDALVHFDLAYLHRKLVYHMNKEQYNHLLHLHRKLI